MNIVIIGAGVMGLSCALDRQTKATPTSITVLDSRACGQGASTAALGALWPASPLVTGPLQTLHRLSLSLFESFAHRLSADSGLPVSFRRGGRLEFLTPGKAVTRAHEEAAAPPPWPNLPHPAMEFLDESQTAHLIPGLGIRQPALLCRATAQVNVHQLIAALRAACLRAGITLHENSPVQSLDHHANRITAVQLRDRRIPADIVLVTTGAWTATLSPLTASAAPVRPAKGQGLALARPPGVTFTSILKSGPIYLVPWDTEIWVGSTTELQAAFDETPTPAARDLLLAGATQIIPALKNAHLLRHWAGLRPQNPAKGHPPIMGPHPTLQNLHLCTAHFKTGIGMAPLSSHLLTRSILENTPPPELLPFLPARKPTPEEIRNSNDE